MELVCAVIYFLGLALCIAIGAGGVSLGQGYAGGIAAQGVARQTLAYGPVRQALLVGCAFLESGCVFSLIVTLVYLFHFKAGQPLLHDAMVLGVAALAMGIVAGIIGMVSGRIVAGAIKSMARQPYHGSRILSLMMVAQILLEAPMVFMFIIAFLIKGWVSPTMSLLYAVQLMGGSMIFACGTIGPAIGQSTFCSAVCESVGLNMTMYSQIFSFSFIVQAMIETPIVFALLVSLMTMMSTPFAGVSVIELIALCVGVASAIGFGSAGAAIGSGRAAAAAVRCMADNPAQAASLARLGIFCQAIIDTAVIYSLIISVLLIKKSM